MDGFVKAFEESGEELVGIGGEAKDFRRSDSDLRIFISEERLDEFCWNTGGSKCIENAFLD
ncbi:MAG: hypothetical protein RL215_1660, partial [Planctomycetota bacterium]